MTNSTLIPCRCCIYYRLDRSGTGECQRLQISVKGWWEACDLAVPSAVCSNKQVG